jgi:hypothetical protein
MSPNFLRDVAREMQESHEINFGKRKYMLSEMSRDELMDLHNVIHNDIRLIRRGMRGKSRGDRMKVLSLMQYRRMQTMVIRMEAREKREIV